MSRMTSRNHPPVSSAGKVAAVLLLLVAGFQVTLAAGAPFGEAAMGGSNPGVLPNILRVSSGVAALAYLLLAGVAGTRGPEQRFVGDSCTPRPH